MNNLQTQTSQQDPEPEKEHNFHNTNNNIDDFGMLDYDVDSSCSTPYVSAPSSPGRASSGGGGYYYSAPASPMHFLLSSSYSPLPTTSSSSSSGVHHEEFEFSARFGPTNSNQTGSSMSSADELFLNGKIRPMKLSTHLERPQVLSPLLDLENEEQVEDGDEDDNKVIEKKFSIRGRDLRLRDKSLRRRTRSMSPLRSMDPPFGWNYGDDDDDEEEHEGENGSGKKGISLVDVGGGGGGGGEIQEKGVCKDLILECSKIETLGGVASSNSAANSTATSSASSSRSSSAGRSSKRWVFLKDFLRSKSEGRSNNKFWSSISFTPSPKDKRERTTAANGNGASGGTPSSAGVVDGDKSNVKKNIGYGHRLKKQGKPVNGAGKRRVPPSPHELHYTANRAQAEELRKKTFLPYKQGLLGCLGFSSKGYGAVNGFARALNPVSSR